MPSNTVCSGLPIYSNATKKRLAYRSALLILSGVEPSAKHQKRAFACVTAEKQCHWPSSIYLDHQAKRVFCGDWAKIGDKYWIK
jgi:hypothetical protein